MAIKIEWDENKNLLNQKNHEGITFEEAATVFEDPLALIVPDDEHSDYEQRFHIIGESSWGKLLVISYHERGETIRIISARKPTRQEQKDYEEGN